MQATPSSYPSQQRVLGSSLKKCLKRGWIVHTLNSVEVVEVVVKGSLCNFVPVPHECDMISSVVVKDDCLNFAFSVIYVCKLILKNPKSSCTRFVLWFLYLYEIVKRAICYQRTHCDRDSIHVFHYV